MTLIKEKNTILAIETSCDETGIAIVEQKNGELPNVLASKIASQIDVHTLTGGVIPEIAAREHTSIIGPLIQKALLDSGISKEKIDGIAVTVGPGLIPALVIGVNAARIVSFAINRPIIPIHHIEGHLYSALLQDKPVFPALALVVSGGHTLLIKMSNHLQYEILGSTRDDAAGEAFDKVARLLQLGYPGGPAISKLAEQGDPDVFSFTRPMLKSGDLDFSFSGLKTDVLYTLRDLEKDKKQFKKADIAAGFQQAVIDTLVTKTELAIKEHSPRSLLLAGGVAANRSLRKQMQALSHNHKIPLQASSIKQCGDNGAMIGQVGCYAYKAQRSMPWQKLDGQARVSIEKFNGDAAEFTSLYK